MLWECLVCTAQCSLPADVSLLGEHVQLLRATGKIWDKRLQINKCLFSNQNYFLQFSASLRPSSHSFPASIKYLNSENVFFFLIKMFIWREKTLCHIYFIFYKWACFLTLPQATCTHPFCFPCFARQNWSCHSPATAEAISATSSH